MTDEDSKAAGTETDRTIDLRDFVPYDEIDPIFFEKTYYLGPQSGLAAIAKYVMRDRQSLGCLRVREGVITLEEMYFADEVRPVAEIAPEGGGCRGARARAGRRADRPVQCRLRARALRGQLPQRASREQLYERAKRADVRGRSDMTKDQLLEALQQVA